MFIFTDPIESESRPRDCFFHPEESGFNPDPIKISNFVSMPVEILSSRYLEGSFIHVWMESLQLFFFAPHRILGNNRSLQKPPPPLRIQREQKSPFRIPLQRTVRHSCSFQNEKQKTKLFKVAIDSIS